MAEVRVEGAEQLRELAKKLRTAPKEIRAGLVKELRPKAKPITREIQNTVRSAPSHGKKGLGHRRRAAHSLSRTKGLSSERARTIALKAHVESGGRAGIDEGVRAAKAAHRAKQAQKAEDLAGLRETMARATSASVTSSAQTGVSLTWRVRASKMANSQRRLPKAFNSTKGWRHPVFGNRENWVAQKGTPYFDVVIKPHGDELRDAVVRGMQTAVKKILHPEES